MITPDEISSIMRDGDHPLDARIDEALRSAAHRAHWPATVAVSGFSRGVINRALCDYGRVGWRVSFVADARDGEFIQIEAPP